jgi:hypothetical protein
MSAKDLTAEELLAGKSLEELESVITEGLSSRVIIARALLTIHDRKLYREKYSSFRAYIEQRWSFKRAGAYQLLKFARLQKLSTGVDSRPPENERQARRRDAAGNMRTPPEEDRIERAMNYLVKRFHSLPGSERAEFIQAIRDLLVDLEHELHGQAQAPAKANPEPKLPDIPNIAPQGAGLGGVILPQAQDRGSHP